MKGEYYKTQRSVDEYINLAKGVNGKELIEKLNKILPSNSALLEIGSGPGIDWRILNKSYNVIGSDNSNQFLNHLINENPNGEFLDLDAITLNTDKKFDGIYSNKVFQHLKDNELSDSIKRQAEILKTNGIICHSLWKGEGSEIFNGLFVNYHEEESLKEVFSAYFEILSTETYKEFEDNDSILLIARKK